MNLHQLTVFRAVAAMGSFRGAAGELRLAQSAISYHIKALETEIGAPLFSRAGARILLTEKGTRLREHTDRIFQAVDEARRDLCSQGPPAELQFGLGVSSLSEQLPEYVKHLQEICPGVRFKLAMGNTPRICELLRSGDVDLGVISLPIHEPDIRTTPLFYEEVEMLLVTNQRSPLALGTEITPSGLTGLPLILYNKTTATRASLDEFFLQTGITPTIFMEVDREETILALVRSGLGATILPRCLFETRHNTDQLHFLRLRDAYLRRQVGVAVKATAGASGLTAVAVRLCQQHFQGTFHPAASPV